MFLHILKKINYNFLLKYILLFIFFGLSIGFPLGIFMLTIGPTRIIANIANKQNWKIENENTVQQLVLLIFITLVFLLTLYFTRRFIYSNRLLLKPLFLIINLIAILSSIYVLVFETNSLLSIDENTYQINKNTQFCFGKYPDELKIKELKEEGYTAIISLLNENVIPAEPILMQNEEKNASKHNIKYISIPMLPWISDNAEAVNKIKNITQFKSGKYYVHCYLGKDRVNLFKHILSSENPAKIIENPFKISELDTLKVLERGAVFKLKKGIYYLPYPTDEELLSHFVNGKVGTVVSLLNPNNINDKTWIDKENKIMKLYKQKFYNFSLPENSSDNEIEETLNKIRKLEQPIIIHTFKTNTNLSKKIISHY